MRRLLIGLLFLAVVVPVLRGDDKKPGAEFQALRREYNAAQRKARDLDRQLQAAKDDDERKDLKNRLQEQIAAIDKANFGRRFFDVAAKAPADPAAIEAVLLALQNSGGPKDKSGLWDKLTALIRKDFLKAPEVKRVLRLLAYSDDEVAEQLVRDVLETNPDRATRARAARALLEVAEKRVATARDLKDNQQSRDELEQKQGREFVERLIAKGQKARADQRELQRLVRDKYADVIPDLSVGKKAPDAVGQDVDGKPVKLSDYRGKVVVLDFWATWCPKCRAMIPHERQLVEKLKDKPFVLVSISGDEHEEALKSFLQTTKMPWTHWWSGNDSGIVEEWNVNEFPSVYVLDARGVIRLDAKGFDDLGEERDQRLAELVDELLKEMEQEK